MAVVIKYATSSIHIHRWILPHAKYQQDAVSYISKCDHPDLFIIPATNPNWQEISFKGNLLLGQEPHDLAMLGIWFL